MLHLIMNWQHRRSHLTHLLESVMSGPGRALWSIFYSARQTQAHAESSFPTTCSVFPASFMLKHKPSFVVSAQLLATFTQRAQCRCRRYAHGAVILRSSLQDWEEACGWAQVKHVHVPKLEFQHQKRNTKMDVFSPWATFLFCSASVCCC